MSYAEKLNEAIRLNRQAEETIDGFLGRIFKSDKKEVEAFLIVQEANLEYYSRVINELMEIAPNITAAREINKLRKKAIIQRQELTDMWLTLILPGRKLN